MSTEFEFEKVSAGETPNFVPGPAFFNNIASASPASSDTFLIGGKDIKVVQFMDYPNFSDPQGGHYLIVSFEQADLQDVKGTKIFSGFIGVRINTTITPASLAIITRLLNPFKGYFVMTITGSYSLSGSDAEVTADAVPWINIQPSP